MSLLRLTPIGVVGLFLLASGGCSTRDRGASPTPSVSPGAIPEHKVQAQLQYLLHAPTDRLLDLQKVFNIGFEDGEPRFGVMAKLRHGEVLAESHNVRVGADFGQIVSAYVTRDGLRELALHPGVERLEIVRHMELTNDISTMKSSVDNTVAGTETQRLSINGAAVTVPFTPSAVGSVTFQMMKSGSTYIAPNFVPVLFDSTLTVCSVNTVPCPVPSVLGTATANDVGGDARVTVSFAATTQVFLQLNGARTGGQTGATPVALKIIGDSSLGWTHGTKARATGKDGAGVIIADVDTGIDFCHPDFIDPATGKSRILFLWDHSLTPQSGESSPPEAQFAFGVEYTNAQINASLASCPGGNPAPVRMRDVDAHGTHTAGTAAGNGGGVGVAQSAFIGAAPKADIIAVKGLGTGITLQRLAEGIKYSVVRARALSKPVVINNSWGGWGDSQDGTTLLEQGVSSVAGRGSIAVFAGGNMGYFRGHATTPTPAPAIGAADPWQLRNFACGGGAAACGARPIAIWLDAKDSYDVTITDQNGVTATWTAASWDPTTGVTNTVGGVSVTAYGDQTAEPQNGAKNYFFDIPASPVTLPANVTWNISMTRVAGSTGTGKWDAFLGLGNGLTIGAQDAAASPVHIPRIPNATNPPGGPAPLFLGNFYTPGQVHSPGTGFGVLQVAALTGNVRWFNNSVPAPGGYTEPGDSAFTFAELGNLASYSSRGPSRDGRAVPQIAAPGTNVISTASQFGGFVAGSLVSEPATVTGGHVSFQGTSMATPNVTGAIALVLQTDPTNFPRPLMRSTSVHDDYTEDATSQTKTGVGPQLWNGAGRVDSLAAVSALAGDVAPVVSSLVASTSTVGAGLPLTLTATATDVDGTVDEYLWDLDGDGFTDAFTQRGATAGNVLVTTAPATAGVYTMRVIVADNRGKTAFATTTVTVTGGSTDGGTDGSSDGSTDGATDGSANTDGGTDGGTDSGTPDSGTDSGTDSGARDSGTDGGTDSGTDSGTPDSGTDSGTPDSGTDSGTPDSGTRDSGRTDSGNPGEDSGIPDQDASQPPKDSGTPPQDASRDSGDGGDHGGGGDDGGCGCRVVGQTSVPASQLAAPFGMLGLLVLAARRRRRSQSK